MIFVMIEKFSVFYAIYATPINKNLVRKQKIFWNFMLEGLGPVEHGDTPLNVFFTIIKMCFGISGHTGDAYNFK